MTDEALRALLSDMSLEEKIGQMVQLTAGFYDPDAGAVLTGPAMQQGLSEENIRLAGSILGTSGAETLVQFQKNYMERHPHHIPMMFMMDVIHGMRTIFPCPLGMGATFDPELAQACGEMAAREAAVSGLHVTFTPMVDLVRDARWGRVMESTGEDPWLNSRFADAFVRGIQGADVGEKDRISACIKHFAAYGAPTAGRDYNTVELSEHTLRQDYLPAYKAGIDAGAEMVMTSFNTVNGIPATTNRWLMRKVLREEMGFDGVLISDFGAILETINHGYSEDRAHAAKHALEAGVDIDMMGGCYASSLRDLVENGQVSMEDIDECVLRILRLKNRLGLFEHPYKDADPEREKTVQLCPEHRQLARQAACESLVLLKNDGLLPLKPSSKIAFIGPYVQSRQLLSNWSVTGRMQDCISVQEAAEEVFAPGQVSFSPGCGMLPEGTVLEGFQGMDVEEETVQGTPDAMLCAAEEAAAQADLVVMLLGEHYLQTGEATSRAFIEIPENQMELFRRIQKVNPQIVSVVFSGRPLDLREISEKSMALLEAWRPGTEGGHAVIDVLTGACNPSGCLPMSMPYCVGQVPVHYNALPTGRPHTPGNPVRFVSRYLDIPNQPLYPFGYGLSYTTFEVSPVQLDQDTLTPGNSMHASVMVRNAGGCEGKAVLQMYVRDRFASVSRPVRELKGVQKKLLRPGEEKRITFEITEEMLRFWRADGTFGSESGTFDVWIGLDSTADNGAAFELKLK